MANLTITEANVVPVSSDTTNAFETGIANAAIVAGASVYLDPATGLYGLFDADSATAAIHTLRGIAVSKAPATGAGVVVQTAGSVNLGAILTKSVAYCGSATAGSVCPVTDITTNGYIHVLGIATTTSVLNLKIFNTLVVF